MIPNSEPISPSCALSYSIAVYEFAPVYQQHARQPSDLNPDQHPMLTEQISLNKPLRLNLPKPIHTAAKARTGQRACVYWCEWKPSPLPHTYYAYEKEGAQTYLLVFVQPQLGYTLPFRLLVIKVDESMPKRAKLWEVVAELLEHLPPLSM